MAECCFPTPSSSGEIPCICLAFLTVSIRCDTRFTNHAHSIIHRDHHIHSKHTNPSINTPSSAHRHASQAPVSSCAPDCPCCTRWPFLGEVSGMCCVLTAHGIHGVVLCISPTLDTESRGWMEVLHERIHDQWLGSSPGWRQVRRDQHQHWRKLCVGVGHPHRAIPVCCSFFWKNNTLHASPPTLSIYSDASSQAVCNSDNLGCVDPRDDWSSSFPGWTFPGSNPPPPPPPPIGTPPSGGANGDPV